MHRCVVLFFLWLFSGLQASTLHGAGIPLDSMNHTLLADFLARSELLIKWHDDTLDNQYVEIYQISEGALACADTLESCPRQRLFVSLVVPDSHSEAYILPASFGWKDPKVVHVEHRVFGFTIIEVQELVAGKNPAIRRFDTRTRRIFLGESEAYLQ